MEMGRKSREKIERRAARAREAEAAQAARAQRQEARRRGAEEGRKRGCLRTHARPAEEVGVDVVAALDELGRRFTAADQASRMGLPPDDTRAKTVIKNWLYSGPMHTDRKRVARVRQWSKTAYEWSLIKAIRGHLIVMGDLQAAVAACSTRSQRTRHRPSRAGVRPGTGSDPGLVFQGLWDGPLDDLGVGPDDATVARLLAARLEVDGVLHVVRAEHPWIVVGVVCGVLGTVAALVSPPVIRGLRVASQ